MANEALGEAQKCLRIQIVKMNKSDFYLADNLRAESINSEDVESEFYRYTIRSLLYDGSYEKSDSNDNVHLCVFQYAVGVRLMPKGYDKLDDEKPKPIAEIQAVFDAEYVATGAISPEALKAFSKDNVGYNVWPYWREYAQSTALRMNASPLLFSTPFYFVPTADE